MAKAKSGNKPPKAAAKAKANAKAVPRANGHGGARPNSGPRPAESKAVIAEINAVSLGLVGGWLPELLVNLKRLADGVKLQDVDEKDGTVEYYTCPPDFKANQYLIDRVLGRPTEHRELSGPEGQPIPVSIVAAIDKVYGGEAAE